jgi:hypothetical protein
MTMPTTKPLGRLPNLIAPHYFSGQLLSDADLDALVAWTRARLSLGGRRDGFGVVCGLEVRVDSRSGHEADLIVGPGYAVGPAGEDIVVATDEPLSLAAVSLAPSDDPKARHPIDLFVSTAHVHERPQPGFDLGDDVADSGATYSRVREGFTLTAERAAEENPERASVGAFEDGYGKCFAPLREFRTWVAENEPGPDRIREWLRSRLLATEFRFAAYELDECSHEELREERTAVRALFWLIQHERNAFLTGFTLAEERVRLGRAWLLADPVAGARTIVALDLHPPYRRRLSATGLPASAGWVNAATVNWEREMVAHQELAGRGIRCRGRQGFELPHRLHELEEILTARLMLRPEEEVALLVYRHALFGRRVVGVLPVEREIEVYAEVEAVEVEAGGETVQIFEPPPAPPLVGTAVVLHGGEEAERIALTAGSEVSIGHEGAHIVTEDDTEDFELDPLRRHGVLRVESDRVVLVVTSRIRLELDGEKVRGEHPLEHGSVIRIGRTEIRIELEE